MERETVTVNWMASCASSCGLIKNGWLSSGKIIVVFIDWSKWPKDLAPAVPQRGKWSVPPKLMYPLYAATFHVLCLFSFSFYIYGFCTRCQKAGKQDKFLNFSASNSWDTFPWPLPRVIWPQKPVTWITTHQSTLLFIEYLSIFRAPSFKRRWACFILRIF